MKFPKTLDEIMLMQPNNITFGQYELSEVQENILTLIIDANQNHLSKKKELPKDLFNQPYVEIFCDEAKGKNSKAQVKSAVKDMFKKEFRFKWVHPEIHKTVETTGTIISTMHDVKGTNKIVINFNVWAVPFFIYFGLGVGGTRFNKSIALTLRGNYTKRIYKIISRWKDKISFTYPIKKLKDDMHIPDSYSNAMLKKQILDPAKKRIKDSGSDVWFNYLLDCESPIKGRKPKMDTVIFYIKTLHPEELGGEVYEEYKFVYGWISRAMKNPSNSRVLDALKKLSELGKLNDVFKRCSYYDDRLTTGKMTKEHAYNSLLKMLREEFKIK